MPRPFGTPLDCEAVGWQHHWLPVADKGPRFVGQICATCDMLRVPTTDEARMTMLIENVGFVLRTR